MSIIISTLLPLVLAGVQTGPAAATIAAKPAAPLVVHAPKADARLVRVQAPADRTTIVTEAGKALGAVKTAQGRFTQTDSYGGESAGAFYINRPGKVRFDYTSPEPMHIVSDGVSVSIEEPKRDAYDAVPLASTPLNLFLRGNVDLQRDGSIVNVSSANGSHFVTLEDKTGEAEGSMVLEFRASDFELLGWTSIDGTGAETRVRLADTKKNVSLKPSLFVVKDPADDRDNRR
jgi:outer membrane lipoprotein-sorting protein